MYNRFSSRQRATTQAHALPAVLSFRPQWGFKGLRPFLFNQKWKQYNLGGRKEAEKLRLCNFGHMLLSWRNGPKLDILFNLWHLNMKPEVASKHHMVWFKPPPPPKATFFLYSEPFNGSPWPSGKETLCSQLTDEALH